MPVVWISTDGLIWLEAVPFYGSRDYPPDADLTGDAVSALANSDGRFVAAISLGAHRGEIWASDDGLTWAPIGKIDGAYWVSRFARDEQGWLAIGTAVDDAGPHGFIWSSPDGVSWAMVAELGPGDGRGLAAGAGGFLATSIGWHGEPGIWTSTDGGMWFLDEAATKGAMGAAAGNVIAIDEGYLGVGSRGATVDDSTMVIWHGAAAP